MYRTVFIWICLMMAILSCKKEEQEQITKRHFVSGSIENISMASNGINSFVLLLKSPNNVQKEAFFNDTNLISQFELGQVVLLKGKVENTSIQVEKIISVDNTNFNLKGIVHSKKANGSGYSYVIQENEEVFTALFSISNLGEDYQEFNIADSLNISGALYLDVNDLHLTVKEIL